MKRSLIIGLVCLNLTLLAALLAGTAVPKAHGQGLIGTDYLTVTGSISSRKDALFILDLGRHRLTALAFDQKRLRPLQGRDLKTDFPSRNDRNR